jgi:membrane-associated phospholipid phosphatase
LVVLFQSAVVFVSLYGFSNWQAQFRSRYQIYWEWELGIPLVPEMMLIYTSIYLLLLLPLFACSSIEMKAMGRSLILATGIAAIFFIAFPTELGFVRPTQFAAFESMFTTLYTLDRPHNLFPSLHVTFSSIATVFIARNKPNWLRAGLYIWLILICISVVLVWQHHVPDIILGLVLAIAVTKGTSYIYETRRVS